MGGLYVQNLDFISQAIQEQQNIHKKDAAGFSVATMICISETSGVDNSPIGAEGTDGAALLLRFALLCFAAAAAAAFRSSHSLKFNEDLSRQP